MTKRIIISISLLCVSALLFASGEAETVSPGAAPAQMESVVLTDAAPSGDLEIFSWWAGDEGPALDALIRLYESQNPDVDVINATVTGGSGVNARAVLKTRMLGGDPPDSFQVHAGQELIGTWVAADRMLDLSPLFAEQGWNDVFPDDLLELLGTNGTAWSVPVNIHRSNVMWYIPANLEQWGVSAPNSWDEFLDIAPRLQANGVTPLALAQTWTVNHLWESVALGVLGADRYGQLWQGSVSWTSDEVRDVWDTLDQILEYTNPDAASLSWQQATDLVVSGRAAFNIMGDWAAGYLSTTLGLEPGVDYGWAASPGTNGVFMFLADSFGYPKGIDNSAAALAWLRLLGSREGQDTFNPLKGSISARTDSDLSQYNAYLQSSASDFRGNRIVGSLVHGVVANEGFMNDFSTVMELFLDSRDVNKAVNASEAVAVQNGIAWL